MRAGGKPARIAYGMATRIDSDHMKGLQMKFNSIAAVLCLAATGELCAAAAATAEPSLNKMEPATLGRLDALFTLCAKADVKNRTNYERFRTEMIVFGEGTPYEMRVEGSDTPAYKEAYAATLEAAGKAGTEELAGQCRRVIGANADSPN